MRGLQHRAAVARPAELVGRGEAGDAGADDDDVPWLAAGRSKGELTGPRHLRQQPEGGGRGMHRGRPAGRADRIQQLAARDARVHRCSCLVAGSRPFAVPPARGSVARVSAGVAESSGGAVPVHYSPDTAASGRRDSLGQASASPLLPRRSLPPRGLPAGPSRVSLARPVQDAEPLGPNTDFGAASCPAGSRPDHSECRFRGRFRAGNPAGRTPTAGARPGRGSWPPTGRR